MIIIILVVVVVVDVVSSEHVKPSAASHSHEVLFCCYFTSSFTFFLFRFLNTSAKTMNRHMITQKSECSFRIRWLVFDIQMTSYMRIDYDIDYKAGKKQERKMPMLLPCYWIQIFMRLDDINNSDGKQRHKSHFSIGFRIYCHIFG